MALNSNTNSVEFDPPLPQSQRERLAYIEFRLYFLGEVSRQDVMTRFGIAPAGVTRDFALYRELVPQNISFESSRKTYVIGKNFFPAFDHVPERVLPALSQGFGDGVNPMAGALVPCEMPISFSRPSMEILAPVTRAIFQKKAIALNYFSRTSGMTEREIVPFALVSDGLRWHVRAFDLKSKEFRDFVITRMEDTSIIEVNPLAKQHTEDIQWNRIVELDLVPHPDRGHPEITVRDHGMHDGVFHLKVRAAVAGYVLRQWHVDCSPDHSLTDEAFRLWLRDPLALYGVTSAKFAPGYRSP